MPALYGRSNFAIVTFSAGFDAAATAASLLTGHGSRLPAPGSVGFFLTIWNDTDYPGAPHNDPSVERVKITGLSGDSITTMARAQDGTSASNHNASGKTFKGVVAWGKAELDQLETELQNGSMKYAAAGGSSNAFTLTLAPAATAYAAGQTFRFKANHTITGAPTIDVNGLGAKSIIGKGGASLGASDIQTNDLVEITYDGTSFQALSIQSAAAAIQNQTYTFIAAGGTANAITLTLTSVPAAYVMGQRFVFKASAANTGAATVDVNSLGAKNIIRKNGEALVADDIRSGDICEIVYDGTSFMLVSCWVEGNQVARAWVTFDASSGTPVIGDSYNVSSITDNGVGDFTINFTRAFANANYCMAGTCGSDDGATLGVLTTRAASWKAVGSARILCYNFVAAFDAKYVHVVFFGDR